MHNQRPKGSLEYIIPLRPTPECISFLIEKISSLKVSWETLSLQIFGSFTEAYVNFLKYVTKLKHTEQEMIQNDLKELFNIKTAELDKVLKSLIA